jgi:aminoglycoside phosphotransferase (APT) family kinase protein
VSEAAIPSARAGDTRGEALRAVAAQFQFRGQAMDFVPYGNGHINDTYLVTCLATCNGASAPARYILQHVNRNVFHAPAALMQNIERVTAHLSAQLAGEPDRERRALTLISARDGRNWYEDAQGETWRAYRFIENAHSHETATSAEQAYQAAHAFGCFQQQLASLPSPRLRETIPDFHHTPRRFAALQQAIAADVKGRAKLAKPEIDFALARESITGVLLEANLPERITHNDTKFNNVLLDDATGESLCVVDLDTVMPGLALYDFGDMVRTTTSHAAEDEQDLSKVVMQFPLFEGLVRGYLSAAGEFLTTAEKKFLAFSGKLITFEIGIRFLTDYLAGDTYFKIHREGHNLDRCRTQFKLVQSIESEEEKMNRLVESIAG